MKCVQLIDSLDYVANNCWQHQLARHVKFQCDTHLFVESKDIEKVLPNADVFLSTLKLRSVLRLRHEISKALAGRKLFVYEQDPWEAFTDQATFPGAYSHIIDVMDASFINTSRWWSNYITSQGFRSTFARMWVNSQYCDAQPAWSQRPIRVGYKGAMHPHRLQMIEALREMGIDVTVLKSGNYDEWLSDLSKMKFFIHDEAGEQWTIGGTPIRKQCGWAKDVEIASRGCIALRLYEDEAEHYALRQIPNIMTFANVNEVPSFISRAERHPEVTEQLAHQSVQYIASQTGWFLLRDLVGT